MAPPTYNSLARNNPSERGARASEKNDHASELLSHRPLEYAAASYLTPLASPLGTKSSTFRRQPRNYTNSHSSLRLSLSPSLSITGHQPMTKTLSNRGIGQKFRKARQDSTTCRSSGDKTDCTQECSMVRCIPQITRDSKS